MTGAEEIIAQEPEPELTPEGIGRALGVVGRDGWQLAGLPARARDSRAVAAAACAQAGVVVLQFAGPAVRD